MSSLWGQTKCHTSSHKICITRQWGRWHNCNLITLSALSFFQTIISQLFPFEIWKIQNRSKIRSEMQNNVYLEIFLPLHLHWNKKESKNCFLWETNCNLVSVARWVQILGPVCCIVHSEPWPRILGLILVKGRAFDYALFGEDLTMVLHLHHTLCRPKNPRCLKRTTDSEIPRTFDLIP